MKKAISGRIATHDSVFHGTIYFNSETGFIENVSDSIDQNSEKYDTEQCVIFPGFGDIHIHAREDITGKHCYKEDFISAGEAAINGGVIQVADMPNNPVPPVDDETYNQKEKLTQKSPIHITLYAGIGPNTSPLKRHVPYKVFMGPSIGELFFKTNEELEETIVRYIGKDVSFHCEDPIILENNKSREKHEDRRPKIAEITATEFAIYLIKKYSLNGKLCHYSTGDGLKKIIQAKKEGVSLTCEVTPTHLFFDRSMLNEQNEKWFQMNPPLRDKEDKEILMQALKDGHIDYLATDHAPHSREEKLSGISGISQLDTYSLFVTYLILKEKFSLESIAKVASKNPGDFIKPYLNDSFGKGFGRIEKGYVASFTILNLNKPKLFLDSMVKSKSAWSPFHNYTFPGSIEAVYNKGKKVK